MNARLVRALRVRERKVMRVHLGEWHTARLDETDCRSVGGRKVTPKAPLMVSSLATTRSLMKSGIALNPYTG